MGKMQENVIPLIGGGRAIFAAPLPLSRENYEHIRKWLDLMERALVIEEIEKQEEGEDEHRD